MGKADKLKQEFGGNINESMGKGKGAPGPGAPTIPPRRDPPKHQLGVSRAEALDIEVDRIMADPGQPRTEFDDDALERLGQSLKVRGQLQPIMVRWSVTEEKYMVIAGERRWRAAKLAGLKTVRAIERKGSLDSSTILADQLIENCLREDLAPIEQARAFRTLMELNGWSQRQLAAELQVHQANISKAMILLDLPAAIQERVEREEITPSAAYELSKVADPAVQEELAGQVASGELKRDEVREKAKRIAVQAPKGPSGKGRGVRVPPKSKGPKPLKVWKIRSSHGYRVTIECGKGIDLAALPALCDEIREKAYAESGAALGKL